MLSHRGWWWVLDTRYLKLAKAEVVVDTGGHCGLGGLGGQSTSSRSSTLSTSNPVEPEPRGARRGAISCQLSAFGLKVLVFLQNHFNDFINRGNDCGQAQVLPVGEVIIDQGFFDPLEKSLPVGAVEQKWC